MLAFGLLLLGAVGTFQPDDEYGYVIIDAISNWKTRRQPTFIGIDVGLKRIHHLPLTQRVHKLPPGDYEVAHIDFGERSVEPDTLYLNSHHYHFDISAGQILVFGRIELPRRGKFEKIVTDLNLVKGACPEAEPLFERYPVIMRAEPDGGEYRISCKDL